MKKTIILVISILLLLCGCGIEIGYDKYEYKDIEGNEGEAKSCWSTYGRLSCELHDGTIISVQSYRGVN